MKFDIYKLLLVVLAMPLASCREDIILQCTDACQLGERHCQGEEGYLFCDYHGQSCLNYQKEITLCESGSVCKGGYCVDPDADCNYGDTKCDAGNKGYRTCKFVNSVLTFGEVEYCKVGNKCSNGKCLDCQDQCHESAKRCNDNNDGVETCILNEKSGCLEWKPGAECLGDTVCSAGVCSLPTACQDECQEGVSICSGDGYRPCGQYDSDPCTDLGPVVLCDYNKYCSNGICQLGCVNECSVEGTRECYLGGFRICANVDSDSCLEWSYSQCALGESCSLGKCAPLADCVDECSEPTCTPDGSGVIPCRVDMDNDSCLDFGFVEQCEEQFVCDMGACVCSCDAYSGVCEPASFHGGNKCKCDPDCESGLEMCVEDGVCDGWCVPGTDPDCRGECACDNSFFCDAACDFSSGDGCPNPNSSNITCPCDVECSPNRTACIRDGFDDPWCPESGTFKDPDATLPACGDYSIVAGYYNGDDENLSYSGVVDIPDTKEGAGWVQLGPTIFNSGSMEAQFDYSVEIADCISSVKISIYGYDSCSGFGADGAEVYFMNMLNGGYDLQSGSVTDNLEWTHYSTSDVKKYLDCNNLYCSFKVKIATNIWQCSHIKTIKYTINMGN